MPKQVPVAPAAVPAIKSVGLIVKRGDAQAVAMAATLAQWLHGRGLVLFAEPEAALPIEAEPLPKPDLAHRADLIVVLGGDGTLLSIARFVGERETPILGVNLGALGFLTQAAMEEARASVERVLEGNYTVDKRITLEADVISADGATKQRAALKALNDVVIHKRQLGRLLEMDVLADGQYFCSYRADGLIVATPTGSTAYALSAGGPIIFPTLEVVVLAPICPHTLSNRPVVLPDSCALEIRVQATDHDAMLTADGQEGVSLGARDRVVICKGKSPVALVRSSHSYFEIWRNKLRWG
jgi:NAD+ kinase